MKIARFSHGETIAFGIVDEEEDELVVLKADPMFAGYEPTGERVPLSEAKLLAPVIPRSKVVAVGKNYREHAAEMGGEAPAEPLLFLKPNTSVIGPGDAIVLPVQSEQVEHEGEVAVVIGRIAKHVAEADAANVIFGYTIANDVTARDLQQRDGQWTRAKGFDTFCPLGPVIDTDLDLEGGTIETSVNGERRQEGRLADMVHSIPAIIAYASSVFTLLPGDVILTGTPAGVGPIVDGDTVEVTVSGLGTLSNPVRARAERRRAGTASAPGRRAAAASARSATERRRGEVDVLVVVPEVERHPGAPGAARRRDARGAERRQLRAVGVGPRRRSRCRTAPCSSRSRNAFARPTAWSRTSSASSDAANPSAASAPAHACQAGETSNRLASSARCRSGP